jgi:hypothetical protein
MKSPTMPSFDATDAHLAKKYSVLKSIVPAWLLAGTLDILAAIVHADIQGIPAASVLKAIASGVMAAEAFRGGNITAAIGLGLHFAIMLMIVLCSWWLIQRFAWLANSLWRAGAALGLGVYAVMNLVVLPLSAIAYKPSYSWSSLVIGLAIHILCVGVPIAWIIQRHNPRVTKQAAINP